MYECIHLIIKLKKKSIQMDSTTILENERDEKCSSEQNSITEG